jgi:tripeptide aminopeptidase
MNKDKLIEVLKVQSSSHQQWRMFRYILNEIQDIPCEFFVYNGCIYITKGKTNQYPCVVSHMDTVHDIVEDLTPVEINGNVTGFNSVRMEQTGIGGDDKVGVFITLQMLRKFDNIKVVFFRDEETGCEGSYDPYTDFFKDCSYILQCDRRGNRDFITSASGVQLSSKQFQKVVGSILNRFGYRFEHGMMTDVMALKQSGILCSMANISCGYYNPHTEQEFVNIRDVEKCMQLVDAIITEVSGKFPCQYNAPKPITYKGKDRKYYADWDEFNQYNLRDYKYTEQERCDCCMEVAEVTYNADYHINMCNNCINQYIYADYKF